MSSLNMPTPDGTQAAFGRSYANQFGVSGAVDIVQVLFWRANSSVPFPTEVFVYDVTNATALASVGSTFPGWRSLGGGWFDLSVSQGNWVAVPLAADGVYKITVSMEDAGSVIGTYGGPVFSDDPGFYQSSWNEDGNTSNPEDETFFEVKYGIDVSWGGERGLSGYGNPTNPAGSEAAEAQDLAAWLQDGNPSLRADSLPAIARDQLNGISSVQAEMADAQFSIGENVSTLLDRTAGLVGDTIQAALTATQTALQAGIDAVGVGIAAVGVGVEAIVTVVTGPFKWWASGPGGMAGHTDPGWVEVDSGAFVGSFEVLERCDRVYVHITTIGEANRTNEFNGRTFLTFAWWWMPTFANMAGQYATSRALEAVLYVPGVRMDGASVILPQDFQGTYSAARFDGE